MFSGRPSVPLSVRASVRPSVIHMVVLCFRDISSICWQIVAKLLSLVHLGTQMTWLRFWSKGQSSRSHHRGGGAQHSMLPSSGTFSSLPVFFTWLWKRFCVVRNDVQTWDVFFSLYVSVQLVIVGVVLSTAGLKDLKELHLDRTLITDEGAAIVKGVALLQSFSTVANKCNHHITP